MRTLEEVDAEMRRIDAQRDALKEKLRELAADRDQLIYAAELAAMPEAKRRLLQAAAKAQVVGPAPIAPSSKVGKPSKSR